METITRQIVNDHFVGLVGEQLMTLIQKKAPTKIWWRVLKAIDHVEKAKRLDSIDDEMGAIRLIAAEEELVVAIFEWLKLNQDKMPEHRDLVAAYKNHQVKLMFYPVLSQMKYALEWVLAGIMAPEGAEHVELRINALVENDGAKLMICGVDGAPLVPLNPLAMTITADGLEEEEVLDRLYQELVDQVKEAHEVSLKQFVSLRADYRNKLLYAEDGGFLTGGDSVVSLLGEGFDSTFTGLLWSLAILLTHVPISPNFGLVSQFISIYRRVLIDTKAIRPRSLAPSL